MPGGSAPLEAVLDSSLAEVATDLQERVRQGSAAGLEHLERSLRAQWQLVSAALDDWLVRLRTGAPTRLRRPDAVR